VSPARRLALVVLFLASSVVTGFVAAKQFSAPTAGPSVTRLVPLQASTLGLVTRSAEPCSGPTVPSTSTWMRVLLNSGPTLVASESVRAGGTYRFPVAVGHYALTAVEGFVLVTPRNARLVAVDVRAGHTAVLNFANRCF
jgi:hypothetical protein